jgi:hypothetical protein
MRETALRNRIIAAAAIAFVLALIITLVWKLRFFDTVNTQLTQTQTQLQGYNTTAAKLEPSLKAQRIAQLNSDLAQRQVNVFRQRFRSLNFDLSSTQNAREITFRRYLNEYYTDYGIELRRQLIQVADESGVVIQTAIKVQTPPQNPEDVVAPPSGFLKPLDGGTIAVTVTGALPNILKFFERINQSEILMTVGSSGSAGVRLENASPFIKASFTVTPYLLASGPDAGLPAATSVTGATTTTGLGGPSAAGLGAASVPGPPASP